MKTNLYIFLTLTILFIGFSISLYLMPIRHKAGKNRNAGEGKLVWQKYNCQSCHQLYGLGGYLGPDLTNVISEKGKGEHYIIGMLRAGSKQMPAFSMTRSEEEILLEFLKEVDVSGTADPRSFVPVSLGMIRNK